MNWRIKILLFLLVFSACKQDKAIETKTQIVSETPVKVNYLIEADAFKAIANHPYIKILDFRKKEAYEKEHIKSALQIWRTDIEDPSYPYKGMMASRKQIETLFGTLGIATQDTLIIYDDNGLCDAARLWWVLQNYDFTNVKLLHGGLNAWKATHGLVTTENPIVEKAVFKLTETPSMKYYVSKAELQEALLTNTVILDTRTLDEFSGKRQKKGAAKAGRIPNSILIDWAEAIRYNGDIKIKSVEDLESIYSQLQITKEDPILVYCHSGVRSAHTTFVLTQLLDYKNVKNYDGSWTEWSYFNDLPFKKDSLTRINN
jgi:thiosulfate/3-mercaptopyruvate sulfurtransferase